MTTKLNQAKRKLNQPLKGGQSRSKQMSCPGACDSRHDRQQLPKTLYDENNLVEIKNTKPVRPQLGVSSIVFRAIVETFLKATAMQCEAKPAMRSKVMQNKAMQSKAKRCRAMQSKAMQNKAMKCEAKQSKAKQCQANSGNAKHSDAKQSKVNQCTAKQRKA